MALWGYQIGLAVSLHAADQQLRQKLMPGAAHYSLDELLDACKYYRKRVAGGLLLSMPCLPGSMISRQMQQN